MPITARLPSEGLKGGAGVQNICGKWSTDQSQAPACAEAEAFQVTDIVT